jgi:hypothetical protein
MRKVLYAAVIVFVGLALLCCGGILLLPSKPMTPEEKAAHEARQKEREARRETERAEKEERDRLAAEEKAKEKAAADKQRDERRAADEEKAAAEIAAEGFVKRKLTHPSSAKFGFSTKATKNQDGSWTVTGTVKAKNALGLELKYDYGCKLKRDGDEWHQIDCELLESQ